MGPYIRVLKTPGAALPSLASLLGALPIGMLGLAVLLFVQGATGSVPEAGATAGALAAGNAVGVAAQGHLMDRHGQTRVLVPAGLLCAASLGGLVLVVMAAGPPLLVGSFSLAGGACIPATTSGMRVLWPELVRDGDLRTAAYALLAVMFTAAMVAGPLIVSGLLLLAGTAAVAVLVAAALAVTSAVLFAAAPASRRWLPRGSDGGWSHRRFLAPGMRVLLVGAVGSGLASGLVSLGVPAIMIERHEGALSGVLFAVASFGELFGGLLYGAVSWRLPLSWRLLGLQSCSAACLGWMSVARAEPAALAPLMLILGAVAGPSAVTVSALLDDVASEGALTRAYSLIVAAALVGSSLGYGLGGGLAAALGSRAAFVAAAIAMASVAVWTLHRRRTLAP